MDIIDFEIHDFYPPLANLLVSCILLFWISNADYSSCENKERAHTFWEVKLHEELLGRSRAVTYSACPWSLRPSSCPFWASVGRRP